MSEACTTLYQTITYYCKCSICSWQGKECKTAEEAKNDLTAHEESFHHMRFNKWWSNVVNIQHESRIALAGEAYIAGFIAGLNAKK